MKQTAVQWFASKVMYLKISPSEMHEFLEWFEEAKKIEKEQIEKAYNDGAWEVGCINSNPKKYYKEIYGKDA